MIPEKIELDEEAYKEFLALINNEPPKEIPALVKLLESTPPWDAEGNDQ